MRCNYLFFSILVLSGCGFSPPENRSAPARSPEMVFQALAVAGVPYRRGGQSPESGFDCSGLVAHVYREAFGIQLPHNARAQSRIGRPVSSADLAAGDLVFYNTERPYSHVGIYLGDNRFIHAPRPGAAVRVEDMRTHYWVRRFNGARRISLSE
jgi:cell wall-associated NlpC family hydrolase